MPVSVQHGQRGRVYLSYTIVAVVWGSTYLAIRVGVMELPPFWMAGWRFLAAGVLLALWAWAARSPLPRDRVTWGWLMLTGVLILGVAVGSMFWAEQYLDSGLAALLAAMSPIFMALYGSLGRQGDRIRPGFWVGLMVGLAGVALLVDPAWVDQARGAPLWAVGVIVGGGQAWAGGSVLAKRTLEGVAPLTSAAIHLLTAGLFLLLLDGVVRGGALPGPASWRAWASLGYLVLFGSVAAYYAYLYLITHMPPARAGTYSYINPVVAVLLGWALLGEQVSGRMMLGGAVILLGLFLVRRSRLRSARPAAPVAPPADGSYTGRIR